MEHLNFFAIMGALITFCAGITAFFFRKGGIYNRDMPSTDHLTTVNLNPPPMPQKPPTTPSKIEGWANAIAIEEGAHPSSNNPGNLKYSTLTASWGATKGRQALDGGYLCQFATQEVGFTALCQFLTLACEGELIISHPRPCTLEAFSKRYAGNPPQQYIQKIADYLGVSLTVDIASFLV